MPSGIVTFVFTDIESSTALWELDRSAMADAVARHDEIVRKCIETGGGYVFATGGDGFAAAFADPVHAVEAATRIQHELASEVWRTTRPVRVRVGLHTGAADERDDNYFGPTVNRAARISDAGHGGQILISSATASLVDVATVDLGLHRLRGVTEPVRLLQISRGADEVFPVPRTVSTARSTLPTVTSTLIGRVRDVESIGALLDGGHRLVTLTGAGGSGKTRLAIAVGHRLAGARPGGVYFVDLGRVSESEKVLDAFAEGLGFDPVGDIESKLVDAATGGPSLVVVDNCEHVLDAVADVVEMWLTQAPDVSLLATSREPLAIDGEHVVGVRGLDLEASVELFLSRRGGVGEESGADDRDAIAQVCERLDRLPLAIELAAARARALAPVDILSRLEERFSLLTGGRRRTRGRQATLRTTIDWSYNLLSEPEQCALAAISVMPGQFNLPLAAAVIGVNELSALDILESLVAQSLIQTGRWTLGGTGYQLLETIRVYAAERLSESGLEPEARSRHAHYIAQNVAACWMTSPGLLAYADDVLVASDWADAAAESDSLRRSLALARGNVLWVRQDAEGILRNAQTAFGGTPEQDAMVHVHLMFAADDPAPHVIQAIELAPDSDAAIFARGGAMAATSLTMPEVAQQLLEELEAFHANGWQWSLQTWPGDRRKLSLLGWMQVQAAHAALRAGNFSEASTRARTVLEAGEELRYQMFRFMATMDLLFAASLGGQADAALAFIDDRVGWRIDPVYHRAAFTSRIADSIYLSSAVAAASIGDKTRTSDALERYLDSRSRQQFQDVISDADLLVTLAGVHWFLGNVDLAARLLTPEWIRASGGTVNAFAAQLEPRVAGIGEEDWISWARSVAPERGETRVDPSIAGALSRSVELGLEQLNLQR